MQVLGTANAIDSCGPLGSRYTSPIIAISSGDLSSYSLPIPIGGSFGYDPRTFAVSSLEGAFVKAVEATDLACPTWGIGGSSGSILEGLVTVGPPFYPLIVPPPELLSFDPQWAQCTGWETYCVEGKGCQSWAILDPPSALIPQSQVDSIQPSFPPPSLSPSPKITPIPPATPSTGATPTPAQSPAAVVTSTERSPAKTSSSVTSTVYNFSQSRSSAVQGITQSPPTGPAVSKIDTAASPVKDSSAADPNLQSTIASSIETQSSGEPINSGADSDPQIGGIIFSAFGGILPVVAGNPFMEATIDSPMGTIDSFSFIAGASTITSVDPVIVVSGNAAILYPTNIPDPGLGQGPVLITGVSENAVDAVTLTAGGKAATLSNQIYSLTPSGNVLLEPTNGDRLSPVMINGYVISANSATVVIDGSTLIPNGPAITIAGTIVSLTVAPSGSFLLALGSLIITINHLASSSFSNNASTIEGGDQIVTTEDTVSSSSGDFAIVDGTLTTTAGSSSRSDTLAGVPETLLSSSLSSLAAGSMESMSSSATDRTFNTDPPSSREQVVTICGHILTVEATAFWVNGASFTAEAPAVTIAGTPVSLDLGGVLIVGTSRVSLEGGGGESNHLSIAMTVSADSTTFTTTTGSVLAMTNDSCSNNGGGGRTTCPIVSSDDGSSSSSQSVPIMPFFGSQPGRVEVKRRGSLITGVGIGWVIVALLC